MQGTSILGQFPVEAMLAVIEPEDVVVFPEGDRADWYLDQSRQGISV